MTSQNQSNAPQTSGLKWVIYLIGAFAVSAGIGLILLWPTIEHMQKMQALITEEPQWFDADKPEKLTALIEAHAETLSYSYLELNDAGDIVEKDEINTEILRLAGPSVKIFYLAAYADLVADGKIDPMDKVDVSDWEAYHLPGIHGGAHTQAMQNFGLKVTDFGYAKHQSTLTWSQVIEAAFRFSDLSAIDFLSKSIDSKDLETTLKKYGCVHGPSKMTLLGSILTIDNHEHPMTEEKWEKMKTMHPVEFRRRSQEMETKFLEDSQWRENEILSKKGFYGRKIPPDLRRLSQAKFGPRATVSDINKIMLAAVNGDGKNDKAIGIIKQYLEIPMKRPDISERYENLGTFGGFSLGNMGIALYAQPKNKKTKRVMSILFNQMPISAWNTLRKGDGLLAWLHMTAEGKAK